MENNLLRWANRLVNSQIHTCNPISKAKKNLLRQIYADSCFAIQLWKNGDCAQVQSIVCINSAINKCLVILLKIDKTPKVYFHCTIVTSGLAIGLKIEFSWVFIWFQESNRMKIRTLRWRLQFGHSQESPRYCDIWWLYQKWLPLDLEH